MAIFLQWTVLCDELFVHYRDTHQIDHCTKQSINSNTHSHDRHTQRSSEQRFETRSL